MYSVNPKVYTSMYSIPSEIVDKHLKFAGFEQLKVILCIFRKQDITAEEIARAARLTVSEAEECIEYWIDAGVLISDGEQRSFATESQNTEAKAEAPAAPLPEIHFVNPTQREIQEILKSNGSMKRLFNEAQEILGKTLGYTMQCAIYSIVNFYGIKPDVANCLLHFSKSMGCTSQKDIQEIAKYWAEHSVTDMASADDYITETEKAKDFFIELAERTNNDTSVPSFACLSLICEWLRWGFGIDAVMKAFDIMKDEKQTGRLEWNSLRHMNGTLKKWRKAGMMTAEDIEKGTKKFGVKKAEQKETSFDVELAEKNAKENPTDFSIKKRKRSRNKGA